MTKNIKRTESLSLIQLADFKIELVRSLLERPGEELTDGAREGAMAVLEEVSQALAVLRKAF